MTLSILDLYDQIIPSFGFKQTDEGYFLTENPSGTATPSTIDGKRLVMPTQARLKEGFGEDFIPFHPLSESLSRTGTSEVQRRLQKSAKAIIGHHLLTTAVALMEVAADKDLHKGIPVKSSQFLRKLTDADKNTVAALGKILANAVKRNRLVTVYLKASGMFGGKKMNRVATIRFPFLNDIHEDNPIGVKLNKKQKETIIALFDLLLPNGLDHEEYSAGTNSRIAPYFTCFLEAYHKTISVLNKTVRLYKKPLHLTINEIPLYDLEILSLFPKAYNEIPPLKGNIGLTDSKEDLPEVIETKPTSTMHRGQTKNSTIVDEAPWLEPKPKSQTWREEEVKVERPIDSGSVDINTFLAAMNPPQPAWGQQPIQQQPQQFQQQQPNFNYANGNQQPWQNNQMFQQPVVNNNPFMQSIQPYGVPQQQPMQQGWGQQQQYQQPNNGLGLV